MDSRLCALLRLADSDADHMSSEFIHVAAGISISLLCEADDVPLYVWTTFSVSVWMSVDTQAVPTFWLL